MIFEEIETKKWVGTCLGTIGVIYNNQTNTFRVDGNYTKYQHYKNLTLEYYNKSLKINHELNDIFGIALTKNKIAAHYWSNSNFDKALEYNTASRETFFNYNAKVQLAGSYQGAAEIYYMQGEYEKSIYHITKSIEIKDNFNDNKLMDDYIVLGKSYLNNKQYKLCIESLNKALELYSQIDRGRALLVDIKVFLYIAKKKLNLYYDINSFDILLNNLINPNDIIGVDFFEINYSIYLLKEEKSYLEIAYNQIQEQAGNLEPDLVAKFLSYPIPAAIVEEWEK